jgi:WD40 repeat protein
VREHPGTEPVWRKGTDVSAPLPFRTALVLAVAIVSIAVAVPASASTAVWVNGYPDATLVANVASPDGSKVFTTGFTGSGSTQKFLTIGYNAVTGEQLWAKTFGGGDGDSGADIAVSPDGAHVFVTGSHTVDAATADVDWATIAYDGATGAKLWSRKYDGPGSDHSTDRAEGIAVTQNGFVVVTGSKTTHVLDAVIRTTAYYASTGATRWADTWWYGHGRAVAVTPDSTLAIIVTDYGDSQIGTFAYDVLSGDLKWFRAWNGPENFQALARDIVVSPSGQYVYSAGIVATADDGYDYALLKYDTSTSAFPWGRRYDGIPAYSDESLNSVAISPDGATLFVTGSASDGTGDTDYATLAYAATGDRLWTKRFHGRSTDVAHSVVVEPGGAHVFVTGSSLGTTSGFDILTKGYDAATGTTTYSNRFPQGGQGLDLLITGGLTVISGTQIYLDDPEGAAVTAAFPI